LSIYKLGRLYSISGRYQSLAELLEQIRPFFESVAKAKTAKIVRTIIDLMAQISGAEARQTLIRLCTSSIEWCKREKRAFLRQRIEFRLAGLYLDALDYNASTKLINPLLREVKRIDDKALLIEIQLLEARVHHAVKNLSKTRASLTSARTTANAIYVPPLLQAEIDMMAGILSAEEKDYKTAYSYFYEAFEGFNTMDDPRAVRNLKYMLLCKVMTSDSADVHAIVNNKTAQRYQGEDIDAMRAVAKAHHERSLQAFATATTDYKTQLEDDPIIRAHLSDLYGTLLEQNLCRLLEPFSRVEISHIAKLIDLPQETVENKISQMILDKQFNGILDQGAGCLVVFPDTSPDKVYPNALEVIDSMGTVVDSLFDKAAPL
jgi:26S proteasome regulatory subunit N6